MESTIAGSDIYDLLDSLESSYPHPVNTEVLGDLKSDTFLDELEKLAASLLQEAEQFEGGGTCKLVEEQASAVDQGEFRNPDEMVGKTPEKLESSRSGVMNKSENTSKTPHDTQWSTEDILANISLDHSYAQPTNIFQFLEEYVKFKPENKMELTCPKIEVDFVEDVDMEDCDQVKMDDTNLSLFQNFHSPKSEISSDQGYESPSSPTYSELSGGDGLNDIFSTGISELFPELL